MSASSSRSPMKADWGHHFGRAVIIGGGGELDALLREFILIVAAGEEGGEVELVRFDGGEDNA